MKIYEDIQEEILHTIETISRVNSAIVRHQTQAEPDWLAIEQYQEIKSKMIAQLTELLAEMDVKLQIAA